MIKKSFQPIIILFLAFMLINNVFAQKVDWGTGNKVKLRWYSPIVLGDDQDGLYSFWTRTNYYYIEKHDKKGLLIYSNHLKLEKIENKTPTIEYVSYMKDRFIVFASVYDKVNDKSILYSIPYSSKTGTAMEKNTKLFEVPVEKMKRKGKFYFFTSKDYSKLLINHYAFYKSEGKYKDRYKLFDNEMNLLVEKEEKVNEDDIDYRSYNYIINNDGSFYFIKSYKSADNYVVSYDAKKDYEKWEEKIDLSELDRNQIVDVLKFNINESNDLVVTGFCYKKGAKERDKKRLNGFFYMKIDNKSKEVKSLKIHNNDQLDQYSDYSLINQSIHFTPNNGVVFISEVFYSFAGNYSYQIKMNDLVVAYFSSEGELIWSKIIPKKQGATFGGSFPVCFFTPSALNIAYYSYVSAVSDDKLYIVFNERPKNLSKADGDKLKKTKRIRNSIPVICTINLADGAKSKKQLFDPKSDNTYLKTIFGVQQDYKSDLIVLGQKRGVYHIGRISFKK